MAAGSPSETTPAAARRRPGSSLSHSLSAGGGGGGGSTSSLNRLRQQTLSSGSSVSSFGEDLPQHVQLAEMEEDLDTEDDMEAAGERTYLSTARK